MASQTKITITHDKENTIDVQNHLIVNAMTNKAQIVRIMNLLEQINVGGRQGTVATVIDDGNAVAATATLTLTNFNTAADTILINGTTLTCVASGATNNQWNVAASASLQATEIARAINASTTSLVSGHVSAAAVGAVVTITAVIAGIAGNAVTCAKGTDAGTVMTFSAARLSGGVVPTTSSSVTYKFGV